MTDAFWVDTPPIFAITASFVVLKLGGVSTHCCNHIFIRDPEDGWSVQLKCVSHYKPLHSDIPENSIQWLNTVETYMLKYVEDFDCFFSSV